MKLKSTIAAGCCLLAGAAGAAEAPPLETQTDRISYGLGAEMARNFKKQDIAIIPDLILQGLKDGLSGERLRLPERELRQTMNAFQNEVRQKMVLTKRVAALDNKRRGEAFLAENRAKDGVTTLPSGVQYKIIEAGAGKAPGDGDMVECRYRGTLLDGSEFDATEPGKSANLKVAALIPGWREALKLMPAGSHWQLFIPPQLAYGERGVGSEIGPNETLLFDVELLAVK